VKDGIIYQLVPQPSFPGYTVANDAGNYGYFEGVILPNSGHLHVSILGDSARVDYIGAYHEDNEKRGLINGQIRRSYYVKSNVSVTNTISKPLVPYEFQAYLSGNNIVIEANSEINANISLISIDGKFHSQLFDGHLSEGRNTIPLDGRIRHGIYLLVIQSKHSRDSLKIVL
jgi:hypothetical protein